MTASLPTTSLRRSHLAALVLLGAAGSFFALANPLVRLPVLILAFPFALARIALAASSGRQALAAGYACAVLGAATGLYWIAVPVHDFGFLPWVLAVPCPVLMGLVLGMYPAGLCWLLFATRRGLSPLAWGALAGTGWICLEAARGWLFTGFPWQPLATALAPWPFALQGLALLGAYGFSGVLAACGTWLALPGPAPRLLAAGVLTLTTVYGLWAVDRPIPTDATFTAGVVQGNVDQSVKWDATYQDHTVAGYIELSRRALQAGPDILFWPETAMPFYLQEPNALSARVRSFAAVSRTPLVTGGPGFERGPREPFIFNRAFLITPDQPATYDKEHLVPFGEYAPFGQDVPILSDLLQGVGAFTPGTRTAPLRLGRLALGMLICYESIFPELAQQRVADGANVLVNLSNDAWFGHTAAPRQHLELAVLRAVEQGRYLVRCTNTGISAVVDPRGRILVETPLFAEAAFTREGIGLISKTTFFHAVHGWLEGLAALAAAALTWTALRRNPSQGEYE